MAKSILALALLAASSDAFQPKAAAPRATVAIKAETTALLLIEYQNEFTTEGGKLHDAVKDSMAADGSDNPNKGLGILAGCAADKLFTAGEWGAEFHASMAPAAGDLVVEGKKGLDAFPGTNLEQLLVDNKIESVALSGFLTNCARPTRRASTRSRSRTCATDVAEGQTGATEAPSACSPRP
ncbi:isochorismatase-like protein [Aureococcus anophagefferens]|nr:isochorismatase-like protein [Aureococcus anophagefferens]